MHIISFEAFGHRVNNRLDDVPSLFWIGFIRLIKPLDGTTEDDIGSNNNEVDR
tara:strand:- start:43 stop:201 length:159 start_codon:yes stop_codon:yes gene_type:complete